MVVVGGGEVKRLINCRTGPFTNWLISSHATIQSEIYTNRPRPFDGTSTELIRSFSDQLTKDFSTLLPDIPSSMCDDRSIKLT